MASTKQQVWLAEYLSIFDATEAARRAGYKWPNKQGPALKKKLAQAIEAAVAEKTMSAEEVLIRLTAQARAEYGYYLDEKGQINLADLIADGKGHLVKGSKETKYGLVVEFYNAQQALELIGKHHAIFTDKTEHSGKIIVEDSGLSDEERAARIMAIIQRAQGRNSGD